MALVSTRTISAELQDGQRNACKSCMTAAYQAGRFSHSWEHYRSVADFHNGAWVSNPSVRRKYFESDTQETTSTSLRIIPMPERAVKLNTPAMAVQSDNEHMSIVTIPANAVVVIVDGDISGNGFVKIRYMDQTLSMYAKDLRSRTEDGISDSRWSDDAQG